MSERIKELREQAWALVSNEERDRGELYEAREQWERCDQKFAELVRADEREQIERKTEEFARKWWKINCNSNLHYSSTLKAHQDFCALQAAIRARGTT